MARFRVGRSRCSRRWSAFQVDQSYQLCSSEKCQYAKHCALDIGDFGVLHCDLDASRVALRLGSCVLLTEGCDQRGILQHLLSALLLLLRELAGSGVRGPELLLRYHVRVAHLPVVDWARTIHRPPTASPVILGTGVLRVSTGTHPRGTPSRQDDGGTRAPALHTLDGVLRFRGDEEYRAELLHPHTTTWSLQGHHDPMPFPVGFKSKLNEILQLNHFALEEADENDASSNSSRVFIVDGVIHSAENCNQFLALTTKEMRIGIRMSNIWVV